MPQTRGTFGSESPIDSPPVYVYLTDDDGLNVPGYFKTKYYRVKERGWYADCAAYGTRFRYSGSMHVPRFPVSNQ